MINYFDLFDLPCAIAIDKKQLSTAYKTLSRVLHPDRFGAATQAEQDEALRRYTNVNDGYRTLKDDNLRYAYLLELHEQMPAEGKAQVPQDFLMEMMDLNEQLMEVQMDSQSASVAAVAAEISSLEDGLALEYEGILSLDSAPTEQELQKLLDYYLKRRYLMRIRSKLNTFGAL